MVPNTSFGAPFFLYPGSHRCRSYRRLPGPFLPITF